MITHGELAAQLARIMVEVHHLEAIPLKTTDTSSELDIQFNHKEKGCDRYAIQISWGPNASPELCEITKESFKFQGRKPVQWFKIAWHEADIYMISFCM